MAGLRRSVKTNMELRRLKDVMWEIAYIFSRNVPADRFGKSSELAFLLLRTFEELFDD